MNDIHLDELNSWAKECARPKDKITILPPSGGPFDTKYRLFIDAQSVDPNAQFVLYRDPQLLSDVEFKEFKKMIDQLYEAIEEVEINVDSDDDE